MNLPLLYNWLDAFDRIAPYANGLGGAEDIDRFTDTCYILIENCGLMPQSPESDVWLSKNIAFAWLEDYILHIADVDRPRLFESIFDHCFLMFQFAYDYIGNPSKIQCEAEKVWLYYFTIGICSDIATLHTRYNIHPTTMTIRRPKEMTFFMARKLNVADKYTYEVEIKEFISEPYIKTQMPGQSLKKEKANHSTNTYPSTHIRAALLQLINKVPEYKQLDKTRKVRFVETIVTGSTPERPQDTVGYKRPTANAKLGGQEILNLLIPPPQSKSR